MAHGGTPPHSKFPKVRDLADVSKTPLFSNPSPPQPRIEHVCPNPMPKITVSKTGVLNLLLKIKENKASGPDGIPGNLLRICANEIAEVLPLLFQLSLDQGCLPSDWKQAHIVPVFKKGDRGSVENY